MTKHNIKIAAIQETKANANVKISVPSHTIIRKDRDKDKRDGLAFIIHDAVKFRTIPIPASNLNPQDAPWNHKQ